MIRRLNEDMDGKTLLDKSIELARWLYGDTSNYEMSSESRMDLQMELSKLIAMIEGAQEYYVNVKKESKSRNRRTFSNRHLKENNNSTRAERINLIISIIEDLENKDLDGITDSIVDIRNNNYESTTLKESVYDGYLSYFTTYFEDDEDGYDFVEKYYGDNIDTFYEELESACEKHVSTFSADDIESFFDYDDSLNPGDMDSWINGTSRFTYKPHSYESY